MRSLFFISLLMLLPAYVNAQPKPDLHTFSDPTLERAILGLRDLFDTKINTLTSEIHQQKTSTDILLTRLATRLDDIPAHTEREIADLQNLMNERFKAEDEKVNDIKVSLITITANNAGKSELWGYLVGGIGLLIGAFGIILRLRDILARKQISNPR